MPAPQPSNPPPPYGQVFPSNQQAPPQRCTGTKPDGSRCQRKQPKSAAVAAANGEWKCFQHTGFSLESLRKEAVAMNAGHLTKLRKEDLSKRLAELRLNQKTPWTRQELEKMTAAHLAASVLQDHGRAKQSKAKMISRILREQEPADQRLTPQLMTLRSGNSYSSAQQPQEAVAEAAAAAAEEVEAAEGAQDAGVPNFRPVVYKAEQQDAGAAAGQSGASREAFNMSGLFAAVEAVESQAEVGDETASGQGFFGFFSDFLGIPLA